MLTTTQLNNSRIGQSHRRFATLPQQLSTHHVKVFWFIKSQLSLLFVHFFRDDLSCYVSALPFDWFDSADLWLATRWNPPWFFYDFLFQLDNVDEQAAQIRRELDGRLQLAEKIARVRAYIRKTHLFFIYFFFSSSKTVLLFLVTSDGLFVLLVTFTVYCLMIKQSCLSHYFHH